MLEWLGERERSISCTFLRLKIVYFDMDLHSNWDHTLKADQRILMKIPNLFGTSCLKYPSADCKHETFLRTKRFSLWCFRVA